MELKTQEQWVKKFDVAGAAIDSTIEQMKAQYLPLKINGLQDKAGYVAVREARIKVKGVRIEVEKTRKELKEDSLRYGRMVDSEAKRITMMLEPIESYLEAQEKAIDDEKERIAKEKKEAEQKKTAERLEKLAAYNIKFSSINLQNLAVMTDEEFEKDLVKAKAIFEAEQAKILEDIRIKKEEADRLIAIAAEQEAERARLAAIDKEQKERAAKIKAEEEAAERRIKQAEADAIKKIEQEKAAAEEAQKKKESELSIQQSMLNAEKHDFENTKKAAKAKVYTNPVTAVFDHESNTYNMKAVGAEIRHLPGLILESPIRESDKVMQYISALTDVILPEVKDQYLLGVVLKIYNDLLDMKKKWTDEIEALFIDDVNFPGQD